MQVLLELQTHDALSLLGLDFIECCRSRIGQLLQELKISTQNAIPLYLVGRYQFLELQSLYLDFFVFLSNKLLQVIYPFPIFYQRFVEQLLLKLEHGLGFVWLPWAVLGWLRGRIFGVRV